VSLSVTRAKDQAGLAVQATGLDARTTPGQPPPPGAIAFQPGAASADATAACTLTPPVTAAEGPQEVVPQGKAKVGPAERTVSGPALTIDVRRPFQVELPANLTLTPGQTVKLTGKVQRQAVFKEAIQIKLAGLPAGVTLAAPPAPLPPDKAEFVLELKVDPKAAPATASLTLACSATVNGMAYNHPPAVIAGEVKK
jgi:hypothetical protein